MRIRFVARHVRELRSQKHEVWLVARPLTIINGKLRYEHGQRRHAPVVALPDQSRRAQTLTHARTPSGRQIDIRIYGNDERQLTAIALCGKPVAVHVCTRHRRTIG